MNREEVLKIAKEMDDIGTIINLSDWSARLRAAVEGEGWRPIGAAEAKSMLHDYEAASLHRMPRRKGLPVIVSRGEECFILTLPPLPPPPQSKEPQS